jgi:hypothetical protein
MPDGPQAFEAAAQTGPSLPSQLREWDQMDLGRRQARPQTLPYLRGQRPSGLTCLQTGGIRGAGACLAGPGGCGYCQVGSS